MTRHLKRRCDPVGLGGLIGDILTGQVEDRERIRLEDLNKDQAAVALGRKGGLNGGRARADSLTPVARKKSRRIPPKILGAIKVNPLISPSSLASLHFPLATVARFTARPRK